MNSNDSRLWSHLFVWRRYAKSVRVSAKRLKSKKQRQHRGRIATHAHRTKHATTQSYAVRTKQNSIIFKIKGDKIHSAYNKLNRNKQNCVKLNGFNNKKDSYKNS